MEYVIPILALLTSIITLFNSLSQKNHLEKIHGKIAFYLSLFIAIGVITLSSLYLLGFIGSKEEKTPITVLQPEEPIDSFTILNRNQENLFNEIDSVISLRPAKIVFKKNISTKKIDVFIPKSIEIPQLSRIQINFKSTSSVEANLEHPNDVFKNIELNR